MSKNEVLTTDTNKESEPVIVFRDKLSVDGYGDFIRCLDCGRLMLVEAGDENCALCGSENLQWAEDEYEEADVAAIESLGYSVSYAE